MGLRVEQNCHRTYQLLIVLLVVWVCLPSHAGAEVALADQDLLVSGSEVSEFGAAFAMLAAIKQLLHPLFLAIAVVILACGVYAKESATVALSIVFSVPVSVLGWICLLDAGISLIDYVSAALILIQVMFLRYTHMVEQGAIRPDQALELESEQRPRLENPATRDTQDVGYQALPEQGLSRTSVTAEQSNARYGRRRLAID